MRYILLDVGGTEIKCGISDEKGMLLNGVVSYLARAKEDQETVLQNFSWILEKCLENAGTTEIGGIAFAFPGPFDYENGISLMRGLNKYDSIYGISIEAEMKKRIPAIEKIPFRFLHDVEAFAIGACHFGEARSEEKVFCLCIGTGAGSAFLKQGIPLKEGGDGIPKHGWIYQTPYKESIIDDYLSVRGLDKICRDIYGYSISGKELSEKAAAGEERAMAVWKNFGEDLKDAITPFLDRFQPDAVLLGGQISKSFFLFGEAFEKVCCKRAVRIYQEPETSVRTMQGLFQVCPHRSICRREKGNAGF